MASEYLKWKCRDVSPDAPPPLAGRENGAISVELLCAKGFSGDPEVILESFLQGFHYG